MLLRQSWMICLLFILSCNNSRQEAAPVAAAATDVWAQYKVWAEEGDSLVTCMLQFYSGGQAVETLVLEPPAAITIDGEELQVDSAGITGAFYEYRTYVEEFAGKHQVQFTGPDGRSYTDTFAFYPFTLARGLSSSMQVRDYKMVLRGLPDGSPVRIVLTDTAFNSEGINEVDTVKQGSLLLSARYLQRLKSGPVIMQLISEEDRHLESALQGQLSVSYGLTRMFTLAQ